MIYRLTMKNLVKNKKKDKKNLKPNRKNSFCYELQRMQFEQLSSSTNTLKLHLRIRFV